MTKPKRQASAKAARKEPNAHPAALWPLLIASALGLVAAMWLVGGRLAGRPAPPDTPAAAAEGPTTAAALRMGPADYCRHGPRFADRLGFAVRPLIGTSLRGYMGLTLSEPVAGGRVYQHPSWDDAGHLGAFTYDGTGNIYVAPAPLVSLFDNPLGEQNKVYRVDGESGAMAELIDLPAEQPASEANPFGVLGLAYDCDTHSLYAGSVAGSTAAEQVGRIYRIDLAQGRAADQLDGVDAMGVGVFTGRDGKRLYFGTARDTGVYSVGLDAQGRFIGEPRLEFYLAAQEGGGNDKAQRITFPADDEMLVKGIEFNYTLRAASETRKNLYTFRYDPVSDTWRFVDVRADAAP